MKTAFLGIDLQNDFCDQSGSLFVPGSDKDCLRVSDFIRRNKTKINYIGMTQDSHQIIAIFHPAFWQDVDGNFPPSYTLILSSDVKSGKWTPRYMPKLALEYLEKLESQGEFVNVVWPEHCVIGTWGWSFQKDVMDSLIEWSRIGNFYQVVQKGQYPLTEHFGAFRANVQYPNEPSTQLNQGFIHVLEKYDTIYLAGEAKTHCVANTLKQSFDFPNLVKKIVILQDCMSNVPGGPTPLTTFEEIAQPIYEQAKTMGAIFVNSTDINL